MKYRVMATDGTIEDFDTKAEAQVLLTLKEKEMKGFRVSVDGVKPTAKMHRCFHNEVPPKPCEPEQEI